MTSSEIEKIEQQLYTAFFNDIDKVINGSLEKASSNTMNLNGTLAYLMVKYDDKFTEDEFDSNGFEYDFWQEVTVNGKDYTISGSGYHGNISFAEAQE